MKKTVAKYLVEEGSGGLAQQIFDAVPGGEKRRFVVDADSVYPLERQDGAAGAQPIDPRHTKVRVPGEIPGELRGCGSLHPQVHFDPDHLGERLHHLDRLEPSQRGLQSLTQIGEPQEQVEIAGKCSGDARAQYLDGNLVAVGSPSKMDLGDRSGCYRPLVKGCEQTAERAGELGLDQRPRLGARERRELVLQASEIGSDLFAEEVGSG